MKSFFYLFGLFLSFSLTARADYPGTLWSSPRIRETLIGVATGPVLGTGQDVVTLSDQKVTGYQVKSGKLNQTFQQQAGPQTHWVKLALYDVDHDGRDEIVLSGLKNGEAYSVIATVEGEKLKALKEFSYYLYVIPWNQTSHLVAQKRLGDDDFSGPVFLMEGESPVSLKMGRALDLPKTLSTESVFSLFSIMGNLEPDMKPGFIYLHPSTGSFSYYEKEPKYRKVWTSGETYGGSASYLSGFQRNSPQDIDNNRFFIPISIRSLSALGVQKRVNELEAPPCDPSVLMPGSCPPVSYQQTNKEWNHKPSVYVVKNEGYFKKVIGVVPSIKNTQIVRLTWTGYGFQEDWNSPRFDGAISDFQIIDWDGDGDSEVLATFLLHDKGYTDTLKDQDSLLIVLDIP